VSEYTESIQTIGLHVILRIILDNMLISDAMPIIIAGRSASEQGRPAIDQPSGLIEADLPQARNR
jgi:hypothetical protein